MTTTHQDIGRAIPAIGQLTDAVLREAVTATWVASLELSPYGSLAEVPQSHAMLDRPLLDHVNEVNHMCLVMVETAAGHYGLPLDRELALATAILHDVDKPLLFRREGGSFALAAGRAMADHGEVGAALARRHGVPDAVAELVRRHSPFSAEGLPPTPEGTVVHYADILSNDLACVQRGVEPIHSGMRLVPR